MSQSSFAVQVVAKIETCFNYPKKCPVSVVLAPIRVFSEEGKIIIAYACSLSNECEFDQCFYQKVRNRKNHDFGVKLNDV